MVDTGADAAPAGMPAGTAFRGVRVRELSRVQAARMAGMLLAGLGADVTRVLAFGAVPGKSRRTWPGTGVSASGDPLPPLLPRMSCSATAPVARAYADWEAPR